MKPVTIKLCMCFARAVRLEDFWLASLGIFFVFHIVSQIHPSLALVSLFFDQKSFSQVKIEISERCHGKHELAKAAFAIAQFSRGKVL